MNTDQRTGDARAYDEVSCAGGDRSEDGPYERAFPLPIDPGMEVIRDQGERKSCRLGRDSVCDQVSWAVLLTRQRISNLHGERVPGSTYPQTVTPGVSSTIEG